MVEIPTDDYVGTVMLHLMPAMTSPALVASIFSGKNSRNPSALKFDKGSEYIFSDGYMAKITPNRVNKDSKTSFVSVRSHAQLTRDQCFVMAERHVSFYGVKPSASVSDNR